MSTNAAVAAAQRRRAGTVSDKKRSNTIVKDANASLSFGKTLGLSDVLGIQSKQIKFLKDSQEENNRHWEANDEFLHQLSEKIDEIVEAQEPTFNRNNGELSSVTSRLVKLEKEVEQLHNVIASLQDELLQRQPDTE